MLLVPEVGMAESQSPWDGSERRKSPRLRKVIDDLQAGVREQHARLIELTSQIAHLRDDVEALKHR